MTIHFNTFLLPTVHKFRLSRKTAQLSFISIASVGLLYSSVLLADINNKHAHQDIQKTAIDHVRSQLSEDVTIKEISAANIDSRIHFRQCSKTLEAKATNNRPITRHQTIGVYCNDDKPWNIYISVKARLLRKMLVSNSTITRGELITENNVHLIEQELKNEKYLSKLSNIIGYAARRTIRPHQIINSSMLQKALLVHKKESVLIYAQSKNIRVSMQGIALKNGRKNEMIKVRNKSSNKIIEALVIDRGIVAVNF
ncbi:MAG: flagellar basal body P-ring formation protein FlgA [gamma proteobacterium symbiont of Taylorina sp.]|nr:flagellar basal body P-ring formation protein FlgA [gamma proteobacterium symbiont of Taylorina sp.]